MDDAEKTVRFDIPFVMYDDHRFRNTTKEIFKFYVKMREDIIYDLKEIQKGFYK